MNAEGKRRKRRRRFFVLAVLLLVVIAARRVPLIALGAFLASGRPIAGEFDYVLLGGGDRELEMAASLIEATPARKIVLAESEPSRLVHFNVLPPSHKIDIERLAALGVPRERIVLIPQDPEQPRWAPDLFSRWHREQQMPKTVVLCEEMAQRSVWMQLRQHCTSQQLENVYSLGLVNRHYPVDRWWQSRRGIKAVTLGYVSLFNKWLVGPETPLAPAEWWDVEQYEQSLRELR